MVFNCYGGPCTYRHEQIGGRMGSYMELAKRMQEGTVVTAVCGDYVIYRKDWLRNNLEQEYVLQKSAREFNTLKAKDGITRLKEFIEKERGGNGSSF